MPSFIESSFTTKVEYERWVRCGRGPATVTADVGKGASATAGAEAEAEAEAEAVQMALAEQLDGSAPAEPAVVESLLSRLQELSGDRQGVVASDVAAAGSASDRHDERGFDLVHPGAAGQGAREELDAVLAAVMAWSFED